ncbi:MAG: 3-methyl-2-oxobutanoate hydroxymethyltransferase [Phycisphaerales bacterium]
MSVSPSDTSGLPAEDRPQITLRTLTTMAKRGEPFACLACYDATTARWLERSGVHLLLAGDSAAQVVLGLPRTIDAPLEFLITITAAIRRGSPRTVVMADMPFLSYHASTEQALTNAGRFMTEGQADIVKLEADETFAARIDAMTRAGIPVCAHVGFRPQTTAIKGVPTAEGRTSPDLQRIVNDAIALEQAGAVMLLVEAVPPEVTREIMASTTVPLIGIGAGTDPHGQILVVNDLLGLTDHPPRFASPAAALGQQIRLAGASWVASVAARDIGGQTYAMRPDQPRTTTERNATPTDR